MEIFGPALVVGVVTFVLIMAAFLISRFFAGRKVSKFQDYVKLHFPELPDDTQMLSAKQTSKGVKINIALLMDDANKELILLLADKGNDFEHIRYHFSELTDIEVTDQVISRGLAPKTYSYEMTMVLKFDDGHAYSFVAEMISNKYGDDKGSDIVKGHFAPWREKLGEILKNPPKKPKKKQVETTMKARVEELASMEAPVKEKSAAAGKKKKAAEEKSPVKVKEKVVTPAAKAKNGNGAIPAVESAPAKTKEGSPPPEKEMTPQELTGKKWWQSRTILIGAVVSLVIVFWGSIFLIWRMIGLNQYEKGVAAYQAVDSIAALESLEKVSRYPKLLGDFVPAARELLQETEAYANAETLWAQEEFGASLDAYFEFAEAYPDSTFKDKCMLAINQIPFDWGQALRNEHDHKGAEDVYLAVIRNKDDYTADVHAN